MKVPYQVCPDLQLAFKGFDKSLPVFADTETCGFYQKVRLVQLYQAGLPEVIIVEWPNELLLATLLGQFHTAWHNSHYDITTIQQQTDTRWVPETFDDTFLLARLHFYQKEKFSLDETFIYVLGYCPYTKQLLDKKVLQKSNWSAKVLSSDQFLYAATDVYFMPQLWDAVKGSIDDFSYKLDMLSLRYALDFQWNGMPVSKQKLYDRYEQNQEELEKLNMPINVNSWQQVRKYLDSDESDGLALAKMALAGNDKAGNVRRARKLIKQNSFLDKFDTVDGRIFGKFLPSARSGRFTSKDQNLQQIPRELKGAFETVDGRAFWYADYAQVELRSICAITECKAMEKLFRDGADLHRFTSDMLFGTFDDLMAKAIAVAEERRPGQVTAEDLEGIKFGVTLQHNKNRQLTKTYNFSLLYGGGIGMLISILIMTANILLDERQATRDRRRWRNLWREVYAWQERGIAMWKKGKPGSTVLGRKYKAKMMTDQLNIENQGTCAEVFKLAMHYLIPKLSSYNEVAGTDFVVDNVIHDSFIVEGPNDPEHYEPVSAMIAESMQDAWFQMSNLMKVKDLPMPVNVKVGTNWGDIENDDVPDLYEYNLEGMAMWTET